ncbi:MAG: hypothetical protein SOU19_08065 [Candidatus Caccosoma sp.]|nr:hypothetical protein [Candidatus Caccosoma sp.]
MDNKKMIPDIGEVNVVESGLSGKMKVFVNGNELTQISKNEFAYIDENNETINFIVTGNLLKGINLRVNQMDYQMSPKSSPLEIFLALLPFIFDIIWGNIPSTVGIFPIVGGAIGGVITALLGMTSLIFMKKTKNVLFKLLIGLGFAIIAILICYLIALAILSAAQQ